MDLFSVWVQSFLNAFDIAVKIPLVFMLSYIMHEIVLSVCIMQLWETNIAMEDSDMYQNSPQT